MQGAGGSLEAEKERNEVEQKEPGKSGGQEMGKTGREE